jgi:hypothetical protein
MLEAGPDVAFPLAANPEGGFDPPVPSETSGPLRDDDSASRPGSSYV